MAELISIDDFKLYKKITKTDTDDEIGFIISSVSTLVKQYCGHSFIDYYSTAKVETFNIFPAQSAVLLTEWPLKEVVSISTRGSYTESYTALDASEYYADPSSDTVYMHSGYWPEGFGAVQVTYKAGYASTPEDVKIACLDLVNHYRKEEYIARKSTGSSSIDNSSSSVGSPSKWPPHIVRVLDLHRNG